ncbi:MAG TPA: histidinol-phosphate transaminase [Vicinamibacteria bacterium]|nr:histidinol-phosphate transaminase [Vicinamibacteria bacterium]
MNMKNSGISRRGFVSGLTAILGYAGLAPGSIFGMQAPALQRRPPRPTEDEYDAFAKLSSNENPWGPYDSVMKAMNRAFKYANRYGYPDGNLVEEIAAHHGVETENLLITAGSGEVLDVVGTTFLAGDKKVLGVEPSYGSVYRHATNIKSEAVLLPLLEDLRQDIPAMIQAVKRHYREIGFVYLCNPNNPTGVIVTRDEVRQLLDGIPEDVPVLIDEAYHHFVDDPRYGTSIPYVVEGRPVVVARTFSKIAALAGMRIGYAIAPKDIIERMRPWASGSVNALAKWGAVTALKDTASQEKVKRMTIELREQTKAELESMGFRVIPSETNFFFMHIGRDVRPVIDAFRERGVLVGRPFPPMLDYLRVSIGNDEEMHRFMVAFKEVFPDGPGSGETPTAAPSIG